MGSGENLLSRDPRKNKMNENLRGMISAQRTPNQNQITLKPKGVATSSEPGTRSPLYGFPWPKRKKPSEQERKLTHRSRNQETVFHSNGARFTTTTEVTALTPSFDWKLKMCSCLTSTLGMQNENGKWQGASSTLGSYI
jgi:hypothetical protein